MTIRTYYTINGEIQSEDSDGVVVDFLTDALGSITATVDQTSTSTAKHRYKPYGEQLTTGTAFRMGWVGSLGYRPTGLTWATHYMRARSYGTKQGQWTTVDPMWPWQHQYVYVSGRPVTAVDPSGFAGDLGCRTISSWAVGCAYPQYHWRAEWMFTTAGPRAGVIVQHVTVKAGATGCDGDPGPVIIAEYWEAWNVRGSSFFCGKKPVTSIDTWTSDTGPMLCSKLATLMTSEACFFSGVQIYKGKDGWGDGKYSGCLPAKDTEPSFWPNRSNCLTRELVMAVTCCIGLGCPCDGKNELMYSVRGCK